MKSQVATSIGNKETQLTTNGAVILNDNDVNRMFGWALFKVKTKYKDICNIYDVDPI